VVQTFYDKQFQARIGCATDLNIIFITSNSKYTCLYLLNLLLSQTLKQMNQQQRSTVVNWVCIVRGLNELCKNNNDQLNTIFNLNTQELYVQINYINILITRYSINNDIKYYLIEKKKFFHTCFLNIRYVNTLKTLNINK